MLRGEWRSSAVAVKQLTGGFNDQEMNDFLNEAELMTKLRTHPNVVLFLGVVKNPLSIVSEFCPNGSVKSKIVMKATF